MGKRSDRKKLGTGKAAAYLLVSVLGVSAAAPLTAADGSPTPMPVQASPELARERPYPEYARQDADTGSL